MFFIRILFPNYFSFLYIQISNISDSACIFRLPFHADLQLSWFCMYFPASFSCKSPTFLILHVFPVFSSYLFMQISNFPDFACISSLPFHANSQLSWFCMYFPASFSCKSPTFLILHVFPDFLFMQISNFPDFAWISQLPFHADFQFFLICMCFPYFPATLSCKFPILPNLHVFYVFSSYPFMQIPTSPHFACLAHQYPFCFLHIF